MMRSRTIANGDIETAYLEIGSGGELPLVLVHGFTGSKLDFRDQLPWFASDRRVIAPDHRGHGESSNRGPYTLDRLKDDLLGFLDAIDVERCHLLGHSMGGMVAIRFALAHADRLASLVLMDTAAEPLTILPPAARKLMNDAVLKDGLVARIEWMKSMPVSDGAQRGIDYIGAEEHWRRIEEKLEQMDPHAFIDLGNALGDCPPLLDALAALELPTTILVGATDTLLIEPSSRMASSIRGARLVTIPHAAHCPQYESADEWRAAVTQHLTCNRGSH